MAFTSDYIATMTMGQVLQDRRHEVYARRRAKRLAQLGNARSRFFSSALVWLGTRMVGWGSSLEGRHSPTTTDATPGLLAES
jgi:hypothetical protein